MWSSCPHLRCGKMVSSPQANWINKMMLKKVALNSSLHKEKKSELWVVMDVNQTYCGDDFTIDTYTYSSRYTPESNMMFYVNHISLKKRRCFISRNLPSS